jgi:CheY-like chemotaxis protein
VADTENGHDQPVADPENGHDILIVEDEPALRSLLAELLTSRGYSVAMTENGEAAVNYLSSNRLPRLILLDLMMPVMNGWELRDSMLANPKWREIPVAILSALDDVPRALKFVAYIGKPVDIGRLFAVVTEYCD